MSTINPNASIRYTPSKHIKGNWLTRRLAITSDWALTLPERLTAPEKMDRAHSNIITRQLRRMLSKLVDYDFTSFRQFGRLSLADLPKGAFIFLLFPAVIAPRAWKAIQRDKDGNRAEFWDVLRRDITTLTLFVFAMTPMKNMMAYLNGKRQDVKIYSDRRLGEMTPVAHGFNDMTKMFRIDNEHVLENLFATGNDHGVQKAFLELERNFSKLIGHFEESKPVMDGLKVLNGQIQEMVNIQTELKNTVSRNATTNKALKLKSKVAFETIEKIESDLANLTKEMSVKETGTKFVKAVQLLGHENQVRDAVVKKAHATRLPADFVSFILIVFALGWLPVQVNDILSRKRRMQTQEMEAIQHARNFDTKTMLAQLMHARWGTSVSDLMNSPLVNTSLSQNGSAYSQKTADQFDLTA